MEISPGFRSESDTTTEQSIGNSTVEISTTNQENSSNEVPPALLSIQINYSNPDDTEEHMMIPNANGSAADAQDHMIIPNVNGSGAVSVCVLTDEAKYVPLLNS